jgi:hypothetical protein
MQFVVKRIIEIDFISLFSWIYFVSSNDGKRQIESAVYEEMRRAQLMPFPDQSIEWEGVNTEYGLVQHGRVQVRGVLPSVWAVGGDHVLRVLDGIIQYYWLRGSLELEVLAVSERRGSVAALR